MPEPRPSIKPASTKPVRRAIQRTPPRAALQQGVLPDGCNTGVMLRVLLVVNGLVALVLLLRMQPWPQLAADFAAVATLIEPVTLASLLVLCALRRWVQHWSTLWQTLLGCLIPAILMWLLQMLLAPLELSSNPKELWLPVLLSALMALVLLHYFELRARAYSPALDEARMQALQARIRPHFLFNSLNAVLSVVRHDPQRAELILEDLSDLFRVLMQDARERVSIAQEVTLCRQYLAIEALRLGARLQVHWEIDAEAEVARIPALLLQPLVENAVHHGVEPRRQPSQIEILIHKRGDRLHIRIANPLPVVTTSGFPDSVMQQALSQQQNNHMALDNIRERLALLYDLEAQIHTHKTEEQFMVELSFPFQPE